MPFNRKKLLNLAKGFYGRANRNTKVARDRVSKALIYSYRDRRVKKRVARTEWIQQINAATRQYGVPYGRFMSGLAPANIKLNRKMLSNLAITEPYSFSALVHHVQKVNKHWYKDPRKFNVQPISDMMHGAKIASAEASQVVEKQWGIPIEVPPAKKKGFTPSQPRFFSSLAVHSLPRSSVTNSALPLALSRRDSLLLLPKWKMVVPRSSIECIKPTPFTKTHYVLSRGAGFATKGQ